MGQANCPTPEQLSAFVLGKLPDGPMEVVAAHASGCVRCQQELQARDAAADALIHQIRRPREADAAEADPLLSQALRQAQELSAAPAPRREPAGHPWLASAQAPDELGRLGPYRILRRIGAGGMGIVYRAEDMQLGREVALKVMNPAQASNDALRQRFLHEARAMAAVTHDHIIPIYQVGEERGVLFLAMPFLQGETLEQRLARVGPAPMPLAEAIRIGEEIAEGLDAAHACGLIHRDVKPSNVWLEAGRDRVKILDFGLARALDSDAHLTQTGNIVGTPAFMSPEQANGKPLDARSDLFSLGSLLYLLCTGVSPFQRAGEYDTLLAVAEAAPPSPHALNPRLPKAVSDLILDLLARDPDQRPSSARAVADALETLRQPPQRTGRLRPWMTWLAAGAALAALAAAAVVVLPGLRGVGPKADIPNAETSKPDAGEVRPDGTAPDAAADDAFRKMVATLPPRKQAAAIAAKLKELNPGFDGVVTHPPLADPAGPIARINFCTDEVTNISPVRALPSLIALYCTGSAPGKGKLSDLSPLRGTNVARLDVTNNPVRDFSPLQGLPLDYFWFDDRPDQDPTPLRKVETLLRINKKPVAEFWAEHAGGKNKS